MHSHAVQHTQGEQTETEGKVILLLQSDLGDPHSGKSERAKQNKEKQVSNCTAICDQNSSDFHGSFWVMAGSLTSLFFATK